MFYARIADYIRAHLPDSGVMTIVEIVRILRLSRGKREAFSPTAAANLALLSVCRAG